MAKRRALFVIQLVVHSFASPKGASNMPRAAARRAMCAWSGKAALRAASQATSGERAAPPADVAVVAEAATRAVRRGVRNLSTWLGEQLPCVHGPGPCLAARLLSTFP